MSRRPSTLFVVGLALVGSLLIPASGSANTPTPLLPDLGMAPLDDLYVVTTSTGQKQLKFTATVVNTGAGPIEVRASNPPTGPVAQRIYNSDGTSSDVPVEATLVYAGDGHNHWHVKDLASYDLVRADNGVKVGTSAKGGFCFVDYSEDNLSLPGAPEERVYWSGSCVEDASGVVRMGISVGWGDTYRWTLPDQYIDITSLANGQYRLVATANKAGTLTELDSRNNATSLTIQISTRNGSTSVKVVNPKSGKGTKSSRPG